MLSIGYTAYSTAAIATGAGAIFWLEGPAGLIDYASGFFPHEPPMTPMSMLGNRVCRYTMFHDIWLDPNRWKLY